MTTDDRHLFGDEQSYIAWKRQQEAEARAEAYKQQRARQKKRRTQPRYKPSPHIEKILRSLRNARYHRTYMARHPERKAIRYAQNQAWRKRNPERIRELRRRSNARHADENRMRHAVWRRDNAERLRVYHREKQRIRRQDPAYREKCYQKYREYHAKNREVLNAKKSVYMAARRRQSGAPLRSEMNEAVYKAEQQIIALRAEGWKWSEVAELTGKSIYSCTNAYYRAKRRAARAAKKAVQQPE